MRTETVSYPSNGATSTGYLARPEAPGSHAGVVVIQEWWGLEPHIKSVADRLAEAGYCAIAPDLFHGKVVSEPDDAQKMMMSLDMGRAVTEIMGAARYLVGRPDVEPKRVGAVGFCMGGRLAMAFGQASDLAGAIAAFYPGFYRPSLKECREFKAPVLLHFGADDHGIPAATRQEIEGNLEAAGKTVEAHTYPDAGHAFFNDSKPSHRAESASIAWQRTLEWFSRHLQGAAVR